MKKFFVTGSWGKGEAPLKFPSVQNQQKVDTSASKKAKKKKKKETGQNDHSGQAPQIGPRPPLAPPPSPKSEESTAKKSIINGRVTKKKKPKATPAIIKSLGANATTQSLSSFESKLKESLMGGRFRFINEQLYIMNSKAASKLFKEDTSAFDAYHEGYRHQVEKWPINPLNKIIKSIKKLPKDWVIADFGCGEGKLAQSVPNKVFSIDLVSCRNDIIASDMANTPLETGCINVAVYCLSLMGTNLNDFLLEANRVLKMNGLLMVAEIQSRFDDLRQFVKSVENCGFSLDKKDTSVKLFYFLNFKKIANVGKSTKLQPFSLKPCVYKKR